MKKFIWITSASALFLLAVWRCPAQVPAFNWVQQAGGSGSIQGGSLAADGSGNVLVAGSFNGSCTFGSNALNSSGTGDSDAFVAKYDPSGHALWGVSASGLHAATAIGSITADAFGNVFASGLFSPDSSTVHSIDFGNLTITNTRFLARLDPKGNVLWAQSCGGSNTYPQGLAADSLGDCYATGSFNGNATFGGTTLSGAYNFFIAKYDTNGSVMWAKGAGVTSGTAYATSIALDDTGSVLVAGYFSGSVLWGNPFAQTNLTSKGTNDLFLAKYDSAGRVVWVSSLGSTNISTFAYALAVGSDNSPCLGGYSQSNANPSSSFLAKYSPSGNVLWSLGLPTNVGLGSITVGPSNLLYVTGGYFGSPAFGATNLAPFTNGGFFMANYDTVGNLLWARGYGGPGGASGGGSTTSVLGDVYMTGGFSGTVGFGGIVLTSGADTDLFLADLSPTGSASPPTLSVRMYPGITINGFAGRLYDIQYSDSLNTNWQTFTNIVLPYSPFILFDFSPLSVSRFYRAGLVQP